MDLLWGQRQRGEWTDVAFACGDAVVSAHLAVLAAAPDVDREWAGILADCQSFRDDWPVVVIAPDLTAAEVLEKLKGIYRLGEDNEADPREPEDDEATGDKRQILIAKTKKEGRRRAQGVKRTAGTPVRCGVCDREFPRAKQLYNHALVHRPDRWSFGCPTCRERFMTSRSLKAHQARRHGLKASCPRCGKGLSSEANLRVHLEAVHREGGGGCTCERCGRGFASRPYLARHVRRHHLGTGPDVALRECPTCGKTCRGRYYYQHVKRHREKSDKSRDG